MNERPAGDRGSAGSMTSTNSVPALSIRRRRRRGGDIISSITSSLENALSSETLSARHGLLQDLDPRVKVLSLLLLVAAISLSVKLTVLLAFFFLALSLAVLSRIPATTFLKRIAIVPVMTLVIALPAVLSTITPGAPVIDVYRLPQQPALGPLVLPSSLAVTEQGMKSAAFLVLRVTASASFAILLVVTTEWTRLLKGLRSVGVPKVFVMVLGMTHRYAYLFLHTISNMFLALRSRSAGRLSPADNRRWVVNVSGLLLGKSQHLTSEVYLAMLSRGYRGDPVTLDRFRLRLPDLIWSVFAAGCAAAAVSANFLGGLG